MSGNFSSAGQLSFFQMPYIQVARRQDDSSWARDALLKKKHFGIGDWDEVTGDIHFAGFLSFSNLAGGAGDSDSGLLCFAAYAGELAFNCN